MGWCGSLICVTCILVKYDVLVWYVLMRVHLKVITVACFCSCQSVGNFKWFVVGGRWTFKFQFPHHFLLSWCFSFERLHRWMLIVSCKFLNPLRWWLLLFLTVRLWCTSYLCCGCQSLLVIVFQLLWSISSLVQMHHCFPWGLLVCYSWPCAHVHGLSRPHECWLCSTSLPGGH